MNSNERQPLAASIRILNTSYPSPLMGRRLKASSIMDVSALSSIQLWPTGTCLNQHGSPLPALGKTYWKYWALYN